MRKRLYERLHRELAGAAETSGLTKALNAQAREMEGLRLQLQEARTELASAKTDLKEWQDKFDADSPHDSFANTSTVLGKEQRRANQAENRVKELEAEVATLRREAVNELEERETDGERRWE